MTEAERKRLEELLEDDELEVSSLEFHKLTHIRTPTSNNVANH